MSAGEPPFDPTVPRPPGRATSRHPQLPATQPPSPADALDPTVPKTRALRPPPPPSARTRPASARSSAAASTPPPARHNETERRRLGRFHLGVVLGQGGVGTVQLADDPDLGRELAVKFLQTVDRDSTEHFVEEAQITSQLQHPNIVPVYELGRDDAGRPWLAMKRIEGESLADWISKRERRAGGRLGQEQLHAILALFDKVCDGVAFAHSRGVIHRDLKPQNVMVGSYGEVLVVDWGLARPSDREELLRPVRTARRASGDQHTVDGDVFGTPSYMPPEQADGRIDEIDERSDIFALGGVLYAMLTGQVPYEGRTAIDTLHKAITRNLVPPRQRAPGAGIPKELQAIVLKAMAERPADRYRTVRDLQADLAAWQSWRPTTAWRSGPIERAVKWTRRHPTAALASSLVVVGALVVAVLLSQLQAAREAKSAAEARELVAAAGKQQAEQQRDVAQEAASERLSAATIATIREFAQRWHESQAAGQTLEQFGASLTRAEVWRYLDSYDDLFRFCRTVGREPEMTDYYSRAAILQLSGDPEAAIHDYDRALELDPQNVHALLNRGVARGELGDPAGALRDYDAVLAIDPAHVMALSYRGDARRAAGDLTGALADFDAALRIRPDDAYALVVRGITQFAAGHAAEAMRDYAAALRINPRNTTALVNRAIAHSAAGNADDAMKDLNEALRIDPRQVDALCNRGALWHARHNDAAALQDYADALRIEPRHVNTLYNRAGLRMEAGQLDSALRDYDEALQIEPTNVRTLINRGSCLHRKGDRDGALRDYNEALRVSPRNADALYNRANLYLTAGDKPNALRDYEELLDVAPHTWEASVNRGVILIQLGRKAEGIESLRASLADCPDAAKRAQIVDTIRQLGGTVPD